VRYLKSIYSIAGPFLATRVARWYIFKQKSKFWEILEGIAMEEVGIFYVHLLYFMVIFSGYLVYFMVIFSGYLVYFAPFWYVVARKILLLDCRANLSTPQNLEF
jgi:hypothetical protein